LPGNGAVEAFLIMRPKRLLGRSSAFWQCDSCDHLVRDGFGISLSQSGLGSNGGGRIGLFRDSANSRLQPEAPGR